jgi:hypothetical protein
VNDSEEKVEGTAGDPPSQRASVTESRRPLPDHSTVQLREVGPSRDVPVTQRERHKQDVGGE